MNPICPINNIGIRHPVMCSDGYMYEEKCIEEWIKNHDRRSPVTRQFIEFIRECNIKEKCLE